MKKAILILMVLGIFGLYAGVAYAAPSDTVNITVTVGAGTSSVSIVETAISFGTVTPLATDRRFEALSAMTVDYFPAGFPWAVRVYTDNVLDTIPPAEAANSAGLRGADGSTYLPMKIWCSTFGPATKPNPEGLYFWAGYDFNGDGDKLDVLTSGSYSESTLGFDINGDGDAIDTITPTATAPLYEEQQGGWLRIPENNEHTTDKFTWRRLVWNEPGTDASLPPPFKSYLAIDASGAKAQLYSCSSTNVPPNPLTAQILNY
ncbi:MAG: hypothetical protein PHO42_02035 [Candidatus Omnitrophica bacterium]|nr:hypothetical protein [Candidatus Omnitrophota bacterium]